VLRVTPTLEQTETMHRLRDLILVLGDQLDLKAAACDGFESEQGAAVAVTSCYIEKGEASSQRTNSK